MISFCSANKKKKGGKHKLNVDASECSTQIEFNASKEYNQHKRIICSYMYCDTQKVSTAK